MPDFQAMQEVPRDQLIVAGDWLVFPSGAHAQVKDVLSGQMLMLHRASKPGYGLLSAVSVARHNFTVYRPAAESSPS